VWNYYRCDFGFHRRASFCASVICAGFGGYVESMAEHALAMARLILEYGNLKLGQFNQFTRNPMLTGGLCGIFSFGGVGAATAWLMHGISMRGAREEKLGVLLGDQCALEVRRPAGSEELLECDLGKASEFA
jgi:hypothetical protein